MKLLFDQNLSPRLVDSLAEVFPGSLHVQATGLARASDDAVWRFALEQAFAIVTRDSDFQERSQIAAVAPKIVWIRRGNCSTEDIATMLRENAGLVASLETRQDVRFLTLF